MVWKNVDKVEAWRITESHKLSQLRSTTTFFENTEFDNVNRAQTELQMKCSFDATLAFNGLTRDTQFVRFIVNLSQDTHGDEQAPR